MKIVAWQPSIYIPSLVDITLTNYTALAVVHVSIVRMRYARIDVWARPAGRKLRAPPPREIPAKPVLEAPLAATV